MSFGRIGGVLVIAGWVLVVATIVTFGVGGSAQIGGSGIGGVALAGSLGLIGCGMVVLGIAGPNPLASRLIRVGLVILGVGLISSSASSVIAASLTYDPLENGPAVITLLVGALATFIGLPLTVLAMLRAAGPTRTVSLLFLAGLLVVFLGSVLRANADPTGHPLPDVGSALVAFGAVVIALAGAAVGVLPLDTVRARRLLPQ
jgi:hypothetical protein